MSKLISGKEALIALVNGEEVQQITGGGFRDIDDDWQIKEFSHPSFKFRLKPRTITINGIEVPAPFEPKKGESFYYITSSQDEGYFYNTNERFHQFGAWRTEEEIKQVVSALRSVFKPQ